MTLRVVDLFAGGGGLSLGFQNAGLNVVAAVENWKPAIAVYEANFPDHPVLKLDLGDVEASVKEIRQWTPDVLIGGPPCQDFSSAGKRDESLGRASLTVAFAQIINDYRPQFFLMENVERASKSQAFQQALRVFKKAGYGLTIKVLDASLCGVPQLRKRLIVLGSLREHDGFMDEALDADLSKEAMTLRRYFKNRLNFEHYYRHPRSYARRGIFSIDEPSPTIRGVNRPVPKGYPGHEGDTCALKDNVRSLTTEERARIQTFPANFKWVGSKTDAEQVIGNAVPVKLAQYVAERFLKYIQNRQQANIEDDSKVLRYQLFEKAAEPKLSTRRSKAT